MIITNAFSANMVAEFPVSVSMTEISAHDAALMLEAVIADGDEYMSAVGHADTAALLESALSAARPGCGLVVPCNRVTVSMRPGDRALVGQYSGQRLPEGCRELPEGSIIRWLAVVIR